LPEPWSIWGSGYIAKLDVASLATGDHMSVREVGRIRIEPDAFPYSLSIDRTGRYAFVACNAVSYVPVIDLATDRIIAKVPVRSDGARAVAFTPDNAYALVTLEREAVMAVIRLTDFTVTRYIPVGPGPRGIAVDESDSTAYISAFSRFTFTSQLDRPTKAHSVTAVHLAGLDLSRDEQQAPYDEILVGHGPCSVVLFNTERVSYDAAKVDAAVQDLTVVATATQ
jgi:DNA-binding beta-propeller fold protein YncE